MTSALVLNSLAMFKVFTLSDIEKGKNWDEIITRVFENLKKEDPIMCDALRELMKPELEEAADKGADKKAKDIAERMIRSEKLNDHDIAYYTGLTVKQVQELKNKTSNLKQELSQVEA